MRYSQLIGSVGVVAFSMAALTCGNDDPSDSTRVASTERDAADAGAGQTRTTEESKSDSAVPPSESQTETVSETAETPEPVGTPEPVQGPLEPSAPESMEEEVDVIDASVPASESETDGESDTLDPVGSAQDASVVEVDCPPLESRTVVVVEGEIGSDTTWTCDNAYRLSALTYVLAGVELTIQPGTQIVGDEAAGLVITRGGRIAAEGTANNPIVFTSSAPPGSRAAGDWGGVVLLGAAPINEPSGEGFVYGLDGINGWGLYGGNDSADSCGTLKYTRIEFAGGMIGLDRPLKGLWVGGCGNQTRIDYLHAHRSGGDGVGMLGGTANLRHILITESWYRGLYWSHGWRGNAQFLTVHQADVSELVSGIFGSNNSSYSEALAPLSMPAVHNFTLVGPMGSGISLDGGTLGQLRNGLIMTQAGMGVMLEEFSAPPAGEDLTIERSILYGNTANFTSSVDGIFDEIEFFDDPKFGNLFEVDPLLGATSETSPLGIIPSATSPAATAGVAPPDDEFFDGAGTYVGAIEPGGQDWTTDWTAFPSN